MATFRQMALREAVTHKPIRFCKENRPASEYFGQNVFDLDKMQRYLSRAAYEAVVAAMNSRKKIDRSVANEIATAMKTWALENGATHYTHLFQPLTGATAEKHEAFVTVKEGRAFERFSGDALVQQEPDASSFPNGGLRNTFEARGYSAWDPTSPVFILDETLCIPSVFVSYPGEALDMKVPLLRSLQVLDEAATDVAKLFDGHVRNVSANIGLEQEYFLTDASLFNARIDLKLCDRTVIGHNSAKDQQLSDHYFGAIPSRVASFMKDFETEAYKLGIQLATRHNEVAPNQFECAPVFCEATRAIDQNMLLMIIMNKVAEKHRLKVIFHEKPFDGINGSGKHCNWSLQTDTGVNLLSPGKTPTKNLQFLAFYAAVAKAVYDHNYLLMSSVCSLSNSWRLGGNEAPPAVMSIFSGSTLSKVFESILHPESAKEEGTAIDPIAMVSAIPEIMPDNTDRNRTSPFAFTGNRFEFRALGASMNAAASVFVLNSIVAESLRTFRAEVHKRESSGEERRSAIMAVIRSFLSDARPVMFEGNGYSKEWAEESARRGLRSVTNVTEAFKACLEPSSVAMFEATHVLSKSEIEARYEVSNELFVKKLQIEARVIGDICLNHVIPAAVGYQNILVKSIQGTRETFGEEYRELCKADMDTFRKISGFVNALSRDVEALVEARKKANRVADMAERARMYGSEVRHCMAKVRDSADHLEMLVDDELWPLPKYRELLFF